MEIDKDNLKQALLGLAGLARDHQQRIVDVERALRAIREHLDPASEQKVSATVKEDVVQARAFGQHPDPTAELIASIIQYVEHL